MKLRESGRVKGGREFPLTSDAIVLLINHKSDSNRNLKIKVQRHGEPSPANILECLFYYIYTTVQKFGIGKIFQCF